MRGTLSRNRDVCGGGGIIPAYAGNTGEAEENLRFGRDHPRVCGEHIPLSIAAMSKAGSSPRMRGTLDSCLLLLAHRGIIPAYAGNTFYSM